MTINVDEMELLPCPTPWCEGVERGPDFGPAIRLHHFGNYRAVCTSCVLEGPLRPTPAEAAAAWNDRPAISEDTRLLAWLRVCAPNPEHTSGSDFSQGVIRGFEIIIAQIENGHHRKYIDNPAARAAIEAIHVTTEVGDGPLREALEQIQFLACNHSGWVENDAWKGVCEIHEIASNAIKSTKGE